MKHRSKTVFKFKFRTVPISVLDLFKNTPKRKSSVISWCIQPPCFYFSVFWPEWKWRVKAYYFWVWQQISSKNTFNQWFKLVSICYSPVKVGCFSWASEFQVPCNSQRRQVDYPHFFEILESYQRQTKSTKVSFYLLLSKHIKLSYHLFLCKHIYYYMNDLICKILQNSLLVLLKFRYLLKTEFKVLPF